MRLTKTTIDQINFLPKGQAFFWDDNLKGFGLRVTAQRKTFIVQRKVDGTTVRKTIGTYGVMTPDEARREAIKALSDMEKGENINATAKKNKVKQITLQNAVDDYVKTKSLRPLTAKAYLRSIQTDFKDWANLPIAKINRDMIETRFKEISTRSNSMANVDFRMLRAIINFAMEKYAIDGEPLIPSNPCQRLKAFKMWHKIERKTRYIRPEQLKYFWAGLEYNDDDSDLIKATKNQCRFILFTGCRDQEAGRLRWRDVDFKKKYVVFLITKNHKAHKLPLGKYLYTYLLSLSKGKSPDDFVFPAGTKTGHVQYHQKQVKRISDKCGVDFSLHDLRRTFASIVDHHLTVHISPYVIKRLLNHTQTDVTAGYIQYDVEDLRKPMQMIEDFILSCVNIDDER